MADESKTVIEPTGNLWITVANEKKLLVSAKHLCFADSTFRNVLDSHCKEWQQEFTVVSPGQLDFPDDDPSAMETLVRLLHYDKTVTPQSLFPNQLLNLRLLADKYNLTRAIAPLVWVIKGRFFKGYKGAADISLLIAAYVLRDRTEFREISHHIVIHHNSSFAVLKDLDVDRYLPENIFRKPHAHYCNLLGC